MDGLTEGRIVHFVLNNGEHRPAIVVNAQKPDSPLRKAGLVNLIIFLDGSNDNFSHGIVRQQADTLLLAWRVNVHYSETKEPGSWHWIEKA